MKSPDNQSAEIEINEIVATYQAIIVQLVIQKANQGAELIRQTALNQKLRRSEVELLEKVARQKEEIALLQDQAQTIINTTASNMTNFYPASDGGHW